MVIMDGQNGNGDGKKNGFEITENSNDQVLIAVNFTTVVGDAEYKKKSCIISSEQTRGR